MELTKEEKLSIISALSQQIIHYNQIIEENGECKYIDFYKKNLRDIKQLMKKIADSYGEFNEL